MNKAKITVWTAIVIHLTAFYLMLQGIEPVATYFYSVAWWTYILLVSGVNHLRRRNSLLFDQPREFLWIFFFSTPVWLFFEIYNFRLNNWYYVGVPMETYLRWPGYVISFGTVLPGIFETETLLKNFGVLTRVRGRGIRINRGLLVRLVVAGALMMLLAPLRPGLFFPLVWVGCILVLDPLLYRVGKTGSTFLGQAEKGDYALVTRLLATGLVCGGLWEFWNYWASAKWIYTVPHLGFLKIFEMPLLGFFGFPPFALECYLFYQGLQWFRKRGLCGRAFIPLAAAVLTILYCLLAFAGIDRWTVRLYRVSVR